MSPFGVLAADVISQLRCPPSPSTTLRGTGVTAPSAPTRRQRQRLGLGH